MPMLVEMYTMPFLHTLLSSICVSINLAVLNVLLEYLAKALYSGRHGFDSQPEVGANQEMLLTKLLFYGIQATAAEWFRSYLTGRR